MISLDFSHYIQVFTVIILGSTNEYSYGFYLPIWAPGPLVLEQTVLPSSESPALGPYPEPSLTTPRTVSLIKGKPLEDRALSYSSARPQARLRVWHPAGAQ